MTHELIHEKTDELIQETTQCIFCLEALPLSENNKVVERACQCQYNCHGGCLNTWRQTENNSCAICRKKVGTDPVTVATPSQNEGVEYTMIRDTLERNQHNNIQNTYQLLTCCGSILYMCITLVAFIACVILICIAYLRK
jgi:hypothetical protein